MTTELKRVRFLRLKEVRTITGLSRSTIYQWIAEKKFPASIEIGVRAVAWLETDIAVWCQGRIDQTKANAPECK